MAVSDAGWLLVQRLDISTDPYDWYSTAEMEWLVLSADGQAVLRISLPRTFQPRLVRGCRVYGTEETAPGAQVVMRYTLPLPSPRCQ
jgi:hypothetical protein